MPEKPVRSSRKGFSLAEIVVAMLILVLLLFSFGYLLFLSSVRTRAISSKTTAQILAENLITRIENLQWDTIEKRCCFNGLQGEKPVHDGQPDQFPPSPYPRTVVNNNYYNNDVDISHKTEYFFTVSSFYDPEIPATEDLLCVAINVYWYEESRGRKLNRLTLTTEIFNRQ
ncbi:MAG: prepilin-type N-terminal cleavage/methylation domain-containing protein [Candidatus Xenobiia bacterium LiM19]